MNNGISDWSLSCSFPPICHCFPSSHAAGPLSIPAAAAASLRPRYKLEFSNIYIDVHCILHRYTQYYEKVPASVFSLLKAPSHLKSYYPSKTLWSCACRQGSLLTINYINGEDSDFLNVSFLCFCQNWRTLQTIWNKTNIPATIRAGETQECWLFVCLQSSSSSSPLFSGEFSEWFLLVPSCPISSHLVFTMEYWHYLTRH